MFRRPTRSFPLATVLLIGAAPWSIAQDLQPRTYVSPGGTASLFVDPSDRTGAGAGRYEMRRNGAVAWTRTLAFTLCDAVVADDGTVFGVAYTGGNRRRDSAEGDAFLVARLDHDGKSRVLERIPRVASRRLHDDLRPRSRGLLYDPSDDRVVIRLDSERRRHGETWWTYRAATGALLEKLELDSGTPEGTPQSTVVDARVMTGAPLVLTQWVRVEGDGESPARIAARFALVDGRCRLVWVLDLPRRPMGAREARAQLREDDAIRAPGAILDVSGSRRFEIRDVAGGQRVTFTVEPKPNAADRWTVREVATSPYVEPGAAAIGREIPVVSLRRIGSIVLDRRAITSDGLGRISALTVTPEGGIHALDESTGAVHVFSRSGERLHVCRPDRGDYEEPIPLASLTVSSYGEVLVARKRKVPFGPIDFLRYSATGARLGVETFAVDELSQELHCQWRSGRRWLLGTQRIHLLDASGGTARSIERDAEGRWLQTLRAGGVAPDGSLVCITAEPRPKRNARKPAKATVFTSAGDPVVTWDVSPDVRSWADVAFDGKRVLYFDDAMVGDPPIRRTSLVAVEPGGEPLFQVQPPRAGEPMRAFLVAGASDSELWLHDGNATIDRFALP